METPSCKGVALEGVKKFPGERRRNKEKSVQGSPEGTEGAMAMAKGTDQRCDSLQPEA